MTSYKNLFENKHTLIGMVHLGPLLGYPEHHSLDPIIENAIYDAKILQYAGYDAILVENNYDLPHKEFVEPSVICSLCRCIEEIKKVVTIPTGVCVLWNDYKTALSLAKIYKLDFIRIAVFVDHVKTDFGEIDACYSELRKFREEIGEKDTLIFTDIQVKHSELLNKQPISKSALDAIKEGSDGLIVTGKWTGDVPDLEKIQEVRTAVGDFPIIIGSGTDENNIPSLMTLANCFIVGTSIKVGESKDKATERNLKPYENRLDATRALNLKKKLSANL
ncbi:hypothetical protein A3K34_01515 [candidate division WWE3 bacterium RIFOXYC1_FULL_40_10]|nr:MAG: hypothetical protein A3K58_01515 [candidate division WWE3 bacterium RIFOXYB1_FULL_40_22]OGC61545.1 MAG: hypothetical protein A3K37_01515 [candidate division WWE3 bacterium RIFOXYA1_FULL_40_11]OGC64776.1 MAG: hypothetical protein A2326_01940 [candidate division WWE3 bacterium RIFOXYB2_FULL_41_6]OGC65928.1 MAG: hypothetical protein A3K34_01515 [candidate division WWE3 bacterium RIFOXYC1_FULL_40_10]OGC67076.1 MAG: hypothetical protein A2450_04320 [candidate division WWE3 bacterium RIFOXYC2